MASPSDVERSLHALIERLGSSTVPQDGLPDRTIICVVPDLQTAWRARLATSRLQDLTGVATDEEADVRITARSDDLIALIEGRLALAIAFLTGRVRVDASPSDLGTIRRLLGR